MPEENTTGPTILWGELEGKKVKSNDGKKLGHVKRISQNHFLIEKGLVKKRGFWLPKNLGDVYDGEYIWLNSNENEIYDKFLYGEEPSDIASGSPVDRLRVVKERMIGIPSEPTNSSERYKNMRDLK
ncbi:MAG TPA: hypothetical protein VJ599_02990 [Nitrososphaeraceae archaeon]|nr:hypothetical protein [Nitrososphaeraceae archaeon]